MPNKMRKPPIEEVVRGKKDAERRRKLGRRMVGERAGCGLGWFSRSRAGLKPFRGSRRDRSAGGFANPSS